MVNTEHIQHLSQELEAEINNREAFSSSEKLLKSNPNARQILLWTLDRCRDRLVDLSTLETEIQQQDTYTPACPEPFFVVQWLVDAKALQAFNIDSCGNIINDEALRADGLSDDDIDDIIASYAYTTTNEGWAAAQKYTTSSQMKQLLETYPEAADVLLSSLSFFRSPRSLYEVGKFLEATLNEEQVSKLASLANPSVLVNKLSNASAIEFIDHRWRLSTLGRRFLEEAK